MKNQLTIGYVFTVAVCSLLLITPTVSGAVFEITIENIGTNVLTPTVFISHDATVDFFDAGSAASAELEMLAEDGVVTGIVGIATGLIGSGVADVEVAGGAPIAPGGSATIFMEADSLNPWLSFMSMLAVSNDAFIGVTTGDGAIDLFPGAMPLVADFTISFIDVWDAGTEVNDGLAAHVPALGALIGAGVDEGGVITRPHPGVFGAGDIPPDANWYGFDVAHITIIPEPAAAGLFAAGLAMLVRRRRVN